MRLAQPGTGSLSLCNYLLTHLDLSIIQCTNCARSGAVACSLISCPLSRWFKRAFRSSSLSRSPSHLPDNYFLSRCLQLTVLWSLTHYPPTRYLYSCNLIPFALSSAYFLLFSLSLDHPRSFRRPLFFSLTCSHRFCLCCFLSLPLSLSLGRALLIKRLSILFSLKFVTGSPPLLLSPLPPPPFPLAASAPSTCCAY